MSRPTLARITAVSVLFALSCVPSATAHAQGGPHGVWNGAIEVPGQALEVIVTLRQGADGAWNGSIDIPAQGLADFPLSSVSTTGDDVSFAMAGVPGEPVFAGVWDETGGTITGDFRQGGSTFPFTLTRSGDAPEEDAGTTVSADTAAAIVGNWSGTIAAGGANLRIVFHVEYADGNLSGTMDSPDQGQNGLPLSAVTFDGTTFRADMDYAGAYFEGALSDDGASIQGNWNQGGGSAPLTLQKQ